MYFSSLFNATARLQFLQQSIINGYLTCSLIASAIAFARTVNRKKASYCWFPYHYWRIAKRKRSDHHKNIRKCQKKLCFCLMRQSISLLKVGMETTGTQLETFQDRGAFVVLGNFCKHFVKNTRKKGPVANNLGVFSPRYPKTTFWMENLTQRWTQSGHLFLIFRIGQGRPLPPLPPLPSLVARLSIIIKCETFSSR